MSTNYREEYGSGRENPALIGSTKMLPKAIHHFPYQIRVIIVYVLDYLHLFIVVISYTCTHVLFS